MKDYDSSRTGGQAMKLTDEQAIRKGVELAPGWRFTDTGLGTYKLSYGGWNDLHPRMARAALAADLVDMVDRLTDYRFQSMKECSVVNFIRSEGYGTEVSGAIGTDRRMNTIHAVVAFFEAHPELIAAAQEGNDHE